MKNILKYTTFKFVKSILNCSYILFVFIFSYSCSFAKDYKDSGIVMEFTNHNFSKIPWNKEVSYIFKFTSSGKAPLVINDVKTSCGCTVPEWTKKPIKPNGNGEIKIKYDAAFPGVFNKTITVYFNGKDSPQTLTIKGEVEYPEDLEATKNE